MKMRDAHPAAVFFAVFILFLGGVGTVGFAAEQMVSRKAAVTHRKPGEPVIETAKVKRIFKVKSRAVEQRAPTTLYSHGDPTAQEQLLLEMVNRARADPTAEGVRLAETTDPDVLSAYSYFSVDTNQVKSDFAGYASQPPLAFNPNLITSARRHTNDMATNDFQDHTGSDGSTLKTRTADAGYTGWSALGENIYAYCKSIWYGHCGLNVDWGVVSLGHRKNIMNFSGSVFNEIGIGIVAESDDATQVGPLVVTQDFGLRSGKTFLVGVVYQDSDGDGFYSEGEGLSGVTVMPDSGTYYAVTSTSGGYAIPLSASSGTLGVTFSGGSLSASQTKSVTLTGDNVKLDLVATSGGGGGGGGTGSGPSITAGPAASPAAPNVNETVTFTVTASGATSYSWDFGDGATDSGASATHIYTTAGTYTVTVTVTDGTTSTSASVSVTVSSSSTSGADSSVSLTGRVSQGSGNAPLLSTFNASGTDGNGAAITDFSWNFGDGSTGTGASVSHTYSSPGIYAVYLTGTDANGNYNMLSYVVVVGSSSGAGTGTTAPSSTTISPKNLAARLNFKKDDRDSLSFKGEIELPAGLDPTSMTGAISIGNVVANFTLDDKGRAKAVSGKNRLKLRYKRPKKGAALGAGVIAKLQVRLRGDFSDELVWQGAYNTTADTVLSDIAVHFVLGGQTYSGTLNATYKAKLDRNGRLKARYK